MSNELEDFEKYIIKEMKNDVKKINTDVEKILKKNVQGLVYDNFSPSTYTRTNELKNSINRKESVAEGIVFFDESKLNHKSAVTGDSVGKFIPRWIDKGHDDDKGDNMYHKYPARNFIEKTIKELEQKYGEGTFEVLDDSI